MSFTNDNALQLNQLPLSVDFPEEFDKFLLEMTLLYRRIANSVNSKEGALFSLQELGNFQQYFMQGNTGVFRNTFRKVFDMVNLNGGPIGAGATITFAHGITGITAISHIYGGAINSDTPTKFLPLPYVSTTDITNQIQIYLDPTNVTLINGASQSILNQAYIVSEYLKN